MRLESPASPPTLSRTRERGPVGEFSQKGKGQVGWRFSLSLWERVGVRAAAPLNRNDHAASTSVPPHDLSERIYREVKVMMIGGGAEEIMKELAARQLGV